MQGAFSETRMLVFFVDRLSRFFRRGFLSPLGRVRLALCAALLLAPGSLAGAAPLEVRAIWVTRYDYRTEADVVRIVSRCGELGVSRILFQVRGNGSVFFPSTLEPWSARLGGKSPGFDPLAVALREAKRRGLELEAWVNVMPLWKGKTPPENPRHPYLLHPEWVVVGSDGEPQRLNDHYVCGNPARADFRSHVVAVIADLARRYAVHGVHLDYVRYVTDLDRKLDYSHDSVSLGRFGKKPGEDPEGWRRFKAAQVTRLVREIAGAVRRARPGCRVTAAVFPTRASRALVFQDVEAWVVGGWVDALYPMCYAADDAEYARRLSESFPLGRRASVPPGPTGGAAPSPTLRRRVPVYPGIAVMRHLAPAATLRQIATARARGATGVALFCYASFFDSPDRGALHVSDEALRRARQAAVRGVFRP